MIHGVAQSYLVNSSLQGNSIWQSHFVSHMPARRTWGWWWLVRVWRRLCVSSLSVRLSGGCQLAIETLWQWWERGGTTWTCVRLLHPISVLSNRSLHGTRRLWCVYLVRSRSNLLHFAPATKCSIAVLWVTLQTKVLMKHDAAEDEDKRYRKYKRWDDEEDVEICWRMLKITTAMMLMISNDCVWKSGAESRHRTHLIPQGNGIKHYIDIRSTWSTFHRGGWC